MLAKIYRRHPNNHYELIKEFNAESLDHLELVFAEIALANPRGVLDGPDYVSVLGTIYDSTFRATVSMDELEAHQGGNNDHDDDGS